eukprot:scaffold12678_cov35-Attheya_sp.AAC.1
MRPSFRSHRPASLMIVDSRNAVLRCAVHKDLVYVILASSPAMSKATSAHRAAADSISIQYRRWIL